MLVGGTRLRLLKQQAELVKMDYLSKYKKQMLKGLAAGVLVLVGLMLFAEIGSFTRAFLRFDVRFLPIILMLAPLNYFFRFLKWNYYLKLTGIFPEPRINRYIFLSGLTMTITPGKVGELLKCYLLKEHMDAPVSKTSSIVLAERVTDGLAMVVLAALGSLAYPYGRVVVPAAAAILLFIILVFHVDALFNLLAGQLRKIPLLEKGVSFLNEFQRSLKLLFSSRSLLFAVGIGVVSWGFEGCVVFLAVKALGGEISLLGSFFVVAFSSLLGALSFLPGGLGVAEGSILAVLVLTGIDREMAAAATVITRFSTLWLGVALGLGGLFLVQKELEPD